MDKRVFKYHFPLSVQVVLPENYREHHDFDLNLRMLQDLNFWGVELNIADPGKVDLADIKGFLKDFGLEFTMFASGLTAKTYGLSLSSGNQTIREISVTKCKEFIDFIEGANAGIIAIEGNIKNSFIEDIKTCTNYLRGL